MHSIYIVPPSIAERHICRDKAFSLPCRNCLFVKVVRLGREENVRCLADIEVLEKGLARIYSSCHCRWRVLCMGACGLERE